MAADKMRGPGSASAEIGKYHEILAKDPGSRVFAPLAEAYRKAGQLEEAIETALEGLKHHPAYLGGRVALGRAYFDKRQYAEAEAEMRQVVKAAPDNLMAHKVLAQIALERGDLPEAEKAARMVLLLDPRDAEARQLLDRGGVAARFEPPASPTPPPAPAALPQVPEIEEIAVGPPEPVEAVPVRSFAEPAGEDMPAAAEARAPDAAPGSEDVEPFAATLPDETPELEAETSLEIDVEPEPPEFEPFSAPPHAAVSETESEPELELETFARAPLEAQEGGVGEAGPAPAAVEEEPVFEVFGRPKREAPPRTSKGERLAFEEIELEPTSFASVEPEAEAEEESPFEIFTRDPRSAEAPARVHRPGHGEGSGYREIELESGLSTPAALEANDTGAAEEGLEEELPIAGAEREIDLTPQEELEAPLLPEVPSDSATPQQPIEPPLSPAPYFPVEELLTGEFEGETPLAEPPPTAVQPPAIAPQPPEPEAEVDDGTEAPDMGTPASPFVAPSETAEARTAEELPEDSPEAEPAEDVGGPSPPRAVFDTETLAAIYVSQGFHERAAEIYRRLVDQYPGDEKLHRKLDEVLAQQRQEPQGSAVPANPAEEKLRRLRVLLEAFREIRPQ